MPFGYAPFTRDPLDALVDRRLKERSMLELGPLDARSLDPTLLAEPAPAPPPEPSYLSGLLSRLGSQEGLAAIGKGIATSQAPRGRGRGIERFGLGLAGTAGSLEASRHTKAEEDIARQREKQDQTTSAKRNYDTLIAMGVSPKDALERAFGGLPGQGDGTTSAKKQYDEMIAMGKDPATAFELAYGTLLKDRPKTEPQGAEDVSALAAHYGVSEGTARVLRATGAIRNKPKVVTTTGPNPITGKMETKTSTVMEPVQLWSARELQSWVNSITNPEQLKAVINGKIPDEAADDEELHNQIKTWAMQRLSQVMNPNVGAHVNLGQGRPASER
jgi:hypothetical protein